jgi:putative GTP pyrophosphokinase
VHSDEDEDKLRTLADRAVAEYLKVQPFYGELADVVARIIKESLENGGVKIHSVQFRAKDAKSFSNKAATPSDENPTEPKYPEPIKQITDLAGVRVITHFLSTLADVDSMLNSEFEVVEKSNKGMLLIASDRFGYQSIHYLVKLKAARSRLPEYRRFAGHLFEVQVRTILQHAWAEIEHDIQYKSSITIPTEIRRRFVALAGMLEIADREFQAIDDANKALETTAKTSVEAGNLSGIEITPNSLKLFLDKKLGPDGRMSDWSYEWTTRLLKSLGFRELSEVEKAIEPYDDHKLSVIDSGTRRGQLARFEIMLHAALGEQWGDRHPWQDPFWVDARRKSRDRSRRREFPWALTKSIVRRNHSDETAKKFQWNKCRLFASKIRPVFFSNQRSACNTRISCTKQLPSHKRGPRFDPLCVHQNFASHHRRTSYRRNISASIFPRAE